MDDPLFPFNSIRLLIRTSIVPVVNLVVLSFIMKVLRRKSDIFLYLTVDSFIGNKDSSRRHVKGQYAKAIGQP